MTRIRNGLSAPETREVVFSGAPSGVVTRPTRVRLRSISRTRVSPLGPPLGLGINWHSSANESFRTGFAHLDPTRLRRIW
ncbi:hypothetical protein DKG71_00055 [Streptomyces sp. NEAU-S7GS2]|nr:hypothetical protein DKG71_00055 [Streptomyces sp. NEAU-S7GS2]